jgi:scyllo-inositol 2-dehydrogenase (NADP+)
MSDVIRLGIVGFGRIVELIHLPIIKKMGSISVAGVYDLTPERSALAARRGLPVFESLSELLEEKLDAVLVATPPVSHYETARLALLAGAHVLIEKPVTVQTSEAVMLMQLAGRLGKIVSVFHNRRFDADFKFVKRALEEKLAGETLFIERRHHMFGSGASFGVKSYDPEWRNRQSSGGGAILDWGVHLADQLLLLPLGNIQSVRSFSHRLPWNQGDTEDYVHGELVFDSGVTAFMEVNFASQAKLPLWVIGGDRATIQVNSDKEAVLLEKGQEPVILPLESNSLSAAAEIYSSFERAIRGEGQPEVTLEQAVQVMALLEKIKQGGMGHSAMESIGLRGS